MKILFIVIFPIICTLDQVQLSAAADYKLTEKMVKTDENGFPDIEKEHFVDWQQSNTIVKVLSEKIENLEKKVKNLENENSKQNKEIESAKQILSQEMERFASELQMEMQSQTEYLNERLLNQSYEVEQILLTAHDTMLDVAEQLNHVTGNNTMQLNDTLTIVEKLNDDIYRIENLCVTKTKSFDAETRKLQNEIEQLKKFHTPTPTPLPSCGLTGSALASRIKVGTRVVRGRDWQWDNQDHYQRKPATGIVTEIQGNGWVRVKWESANENNYRIGYQGKYDLKLAECL